MYDTNGQINPFIGTSVGSYPVQGGTFGPNAGSDGTLSLGPLQLMYSAPSPSLSENIQYDYQNSPNDRTNHCNFNAAFLHVDSEGHRVPLDLVIPTTTVNDCGMFGVSPILEGGGSGVVAIKNPIGVDSGDISVTDPQGNFFDYPYEDSNGNPIGPTISAAASYAYFIDDTGRSLVYSPTLNNVNHESLATLAVPGISGSFSYEYINVSATGVTLQSRLFSPSDVSPYCKPAQPLTAGVTDKLLHAIHLPDGSSYTFDYDPASELLSRITYPTGAKVEYEWGINAMSESTGYIPGPFSSGQHISESPGSCFYTHDSLVIKNRTVFTDGVNPSLKQHFDYSTSWRVGGATDWSSKTTVVTTQDLLANDTSPTITTYTYAPMYVQPQSANPYRSSSQPVEHITQYQDANLNVLRTDIKTWESIDVMKSQCSILDDGSASGTFYKHLNYAFASGRTVLTSVPLEIDEYGFNSGITSDCIQPTSTPAKQTVYKYALFQSPAWWVGGSYMYGQPSSMQRFANGTLVNQTDIGYDETAVVAVSPRALNHDWQRSVIGNGSRGNVTSITQRCSGCPADVTNMTYDETGAITSTNHNGTLNAYSHVDNYASGTGQPNGNSNAYLSAMTVASGTSVAETQSFLYDFNHGVLASSVDVNGNSTSFKYGDIWNRPTEVDYPDGGRRTTAYADTGISPSVTTAVLQTLDGSNPPVLSTTILNGLHQVVQTQLNSAPGGTIYRSTVVDGHGRVASAGSPVQSSSQQSGPGTNVFFDALGRKSKQVTPDGSVQAWSYLGPSTTFTDERNVQWTRTTDAFGNLITVLEPNASPSLSTPTRTDYGYDDRGNLLLVSQNRGNCLHSSASTCAGPALITRQFQYDMLSRLMKACNPEGLHSGQTCDGSHWSQLYTYKGNGNLQTKTDSRGVVLTFAYDELNRVKSKVASDNTVNDFLYYDNQRPTPANSIGRLIVADHPNSSGNGFSYDVMGRLTDTSFASPGINRWVPGMHVQYDLAGNMTRITYPDMRVIKQTWNGAGQLATVSDLASGNLYLSGAGSGNSGIAYTPDGSVQNLQLGSSITQTNSFNSRHQLCSLSANSSILPSSSVGNLLAKSYFFQQQSGSSPSYEQLCGNAAGNNGNIWALVDNVIPGWTQTFNYDTLNRLTSGSRSDGGYSHTYQMDSFGNMIPHDNINASLNYSIDPSSNRMLLNGTDYQYDDAGNLISVPNASGPARQYQYNALSQLYSVDNGSTAGYVYNGLDERAYKWLPGTSTWTDYVYLNGQPMAELTSDGVWKDYLYANGQKFANIANADTRVHLSGMNGAGGDSGRWTVAILPFPSGVTFHAGDTLNFRSYKHNAVGGMSLGFTDGSNSDWYCGPCKYFPGGSDRWVNQSISVGGTQASPGPMVGKTLSVWFLGNFQVSPTGQFDVMIADVSLAHADGTVIPFPVPLGSVPYGGNMDKVTGQVAVSESVLVNSGAVGAVSDVRYLLADHLGSAQLELAEGGWPIWRSELTPYGQEIGPVSPYSHFKFTGKERDAESGLDNMTARYYSPTAGRFTSPDPLLFNELRLVNPQRWGMYNYALNNPLSFTDPDGRDAIAVNFGADVHGLGHMGIISVHANGNATYSRFGPEHPGSAVDIGVVRTTTDLPSVNFNSNGRPTESSFQALTAAVAKFEDYSDGSVKMLHFKTSEAETAALDDYIKRAQAASDARKLTYFGPFSTCVTYCVRGLNIAGVNGRGAIHALDPFSMIPNYFAWWLATSANSKHQEKITVRIRY